MLPAQYCSGAYLTHVYYNGEIIRKFDNYITLHISLLQSASIQIQFFRARIYHRCRGRLTRHFQPRCIPNIKRPWSAPVCLLLLKFALTAASGFSDQIGLKLIQRHGYTFHDTHIKDLFHLLRI
jgi:hypothetical protein